MAQSITQNEALLKRIVIILGVMLVLGTIGLVLAIILKPSEKPTFSPLPVIGDMPADQTHPLPPLAGRELLDTSVEDGNLVLRLQDTNGAQEIWIVDMVTGNVVRKFQFSADP